MEGAEKTLLFARTSEFEISTQRTEEVLFIAAVLTFLILTGGWYLVQSEIVKRAEVEQGMRRAQVLLGMKYEEQGSELTHVMEDLHEQIVERQVAEERIKLLNEQLEGKVRERTEELQEMNNELETFSYSVSHDLRAPLRHMEGFSRILQQQYAAQLPEEAQHYLKRIRDAASHMSVLVEDLLHLSRIGRQSPQLKNVSLVELVEETKMEALSDASDRSIQWQIDPLPRVDADPVLLHQVLVNLLSNAVKFTRNEAHAVIEVGHNRENGEEVIFVRDNGAGFDPQYADKLFGVFQRLHRQDEFEGTGIGLATVKRIIHKHGGRVWAESRPGHGATFYFSLPAREKRIQYEKQMIGATA
jgi:light-regulated signal transduction histidine kinase (bacteriophytochrome)